MKQQTRFAIALLIGTAALAISVGVQMASGQGASDMQQKVAFVKQSVADNQQRLHQYQWVETTQLTLKGEPKPPKQNMCSYGPDGTVQKIPIGDSQPQEQSGREGRLKKHLIAKKTEEMKEYMQQVKGLLALYVPPSSQRIQAAHQAGNISANTAAGAGIAQLIFKNYAQPGDQMTLSFNTAARKVQQLNVNTYLDNPKDAVTLAVQFDSLPDGTNYVQQTVLNAPEKKIQVTTTNSNYQRLAQ
jgi:hypothetical protein